MLEPLSAFALIVALGVGAEWLASRLGVPSILVLLVVGFLAGPVTGLLEPDMLFGDALFPVVSLAVAVILFEGGMNLRVADLRSVRTPVLLLTTLGVAVTWTAASLAAWWLLGFALEVAFLLGAILVVTGPTVVTPLLRNLDVDDRLETIATWEGIVNDPIGAVLTVSVYELAIARGASSGVLEAVERLVLTAGAGGACAAFGAVLLVGSIDRGWVAEYLETPLTLGVVVGIFGLAEALSPEAGLVAVTVMGVMVANQTRIATAHILEFKESLGVVLVAVLFVVLAARFELAGFETISGQSAIFLALLLLVVRPLSIAVAGLPAGLEWRELVGLSCLAPRGIVAAALGSLFAMKLVEHGYSEARQLDAEVFFVIAGSVVFSSLFAGLVLKSVGLDD